MAVTTYNTRALLSAMLQRVKAVVRQFRGIWMAVNAEDAAIVFGIMLLLHRRAKDMQQGKWLSGKLLRLAQIFFTVRIFRDAANDRDSNAPTPRRWCLRTEIAGSEIPRGRRKRLRWLCLGGERRLLWCLQNREKLE